MTTQHVVIISYKLSSTPVVIWLSASVDSFWLRMYQTVLLVCPLGFLSLSGLNVTASVCRSADQLFVSLCPYLSMSASQWFLHLSVSPDVLTMLIFISVSRWWKLLMNGVNSFIHPFIIAAEDDEWFCCRSTFLHDILDIFWVHLAKFDDCHQICWTGWCSSEDQPFDFPSCAHGFLVLLT